MTKKPLTVPEHRLTFKHSGHAQHLCVLATKREMGKIANLAKNGKFICHICGRVAAKASNLCEPVKM